METTIQGLGYSLSSLRGAYVKEYIGEYYRGD